MSFIIWLINKVTDTDLYKVWKCCAWHRFSTLGSWTSGWDGLAGCQDCLWVCSSLCHSGQARGWASAGRRPPYLMQVSSCHRNAQWWPILSSACVSSNKRKLSDGNGQLFREVFVLQELHLQVSWNQSEVQVMFFKQIHQQRKKNPQTSPPKKDMTKEEENFKA